LSSGDLMTRNTEKRVELTFPIEKPILKKQIMNIIDTMLNDNVKARKINDKGEYEKVIRSIDLIDSQIYFMNNDFSECGKEEGGNESFLSKLKQLMKG
jgi:polyphosphate kinase